MGTVVVSRRKTPDGMALLRTKEHATRPATASNLQLGLAETNPSSTHKRNMHGRQIDMARNLSCRKYQAMWPGSPSNAGEGCPGPPGPTPPPPRSSPPSPPDLLHPSRPSTTLHSFPVDVVPGGPLPVVW